MTNTVESEDMITSNFVGSAKGASYWFYKAMY